VRAWHSHLIQTLGTSRCDACRHPSGLRGQLQGLVVGMAVGVLVERPAFLNWKYGDAFADTPNFALSQQKVRELFVLWADQNRHDFSATAYSPSLAPTLTLISIPTPPALWVYLRRRRRTLGPRT
jgi:hypothetical protein